MADQQKGPLLTAKPLSILIEKLTPSSHILLWGLKRANLVKKKEKKSQFCTQFEMNTLYKRDSVKVVKYEL